MKFLSIVTLFLCFSVNATELNFIEAHLLRLSSVERPMNWLIPLYYSKEIKYGEGNLLISAAPDIQNLYNDLKSKDQNKIQKRLGTSYGKPYDLSAKAGLLYRNEHFKQGLSVNVGAVFMTTDPVFLELRGLLYQDFTATSSYVFKPDKNFYFKPQLNYGFRKVVFKTLTVGDLVNEPINLQFNKQPWISFLEFSLQTYYRTDYGQIIAEINSLPIKQTSLNFWDTFLGYRTPNLNKAFSLNFWHHLIFYTGYSPYYGGKYDVSRTIRIGSQIGFNKHWLFDLFTFDKFLIGANFNYRSDWFNVGLFTFERSYDDYLTQRSRQFGLNLSIFY